MTQSEYLDDAAALLDEVIRRRSSMLSDLESGEYNAALETGHNLLERIDQWHGWQDFEWTPGNPLSPDSVGMLPLLTQRMGLLSDCLLGAIGARDTERATAYLVVLRESTAALQPLSQWGAPDPVLNLNITVCIHNKPTLDPNGRCMRKPPCV